MRYLKDNITFVVVSILLVAILTAIGLRGREKPSKNNFDYAESIGSIPNDKYPVTALAFSQDDSLFAAAYLNCTIKVWDTKTWTLISTTAISDLYKYAEDAEVKSSYDSSMRYQLAFVSPSMLNFAWSDPLSSMPSLYAVDIVSGAVISGHSVEADHDGLYLASQAVGTNRIITVDTGDNMFKVFGHAYVGDAPKELVWLSREYTLYADGTDISSDGSAYYSYKPPTLYKIPLDGAHISTFTYSKEYRLACAAQLAISNNGNFSAIPYMSATNAYYQDPGDIIVMDLNIAKEKPVIREQLMPVTLAFMERKRKLVSAIGAYCGGGEYYTRTQYGALKIWDIDTGKVVSVLNDKSPISWALTVSNNEEFVAAGNVLGEITIWSSDNEGTRVTKKL